MMTMRSEAKRLAMRSVGGECVAADAIGRRHVAGAQTLQKSTKQDNKTKTNQAGIHKEWRTKIKKCKRGKINTILNRNNSIQAEDCQSQIRHTGRAVVEREAHGRVRANRVPQTLCAIQTR